MKTSEGAGTMSVGRLIELLDNIPQQFNIKVNSAGNLLVTDHNKVVGYVDFTNEEYFDLPIE